MNRTCLYKISCSHFVENEYLAKGSQAGWNALWLRINDCQAGYIFSKVDGNAVLLTKAGRVYDRNELSDSLREELDNYFSKE